MWCQAWAYTDELFLSKAYWAGFSVMLSMLTCGTCTKHLVWSGIPEIYRTFLLTLLLPNQIHTEPNPLFIQVNRSFWTDFSCDRFKKNIFSLVSYTAPLPTLSRPLYNTAFTLLLMITLKKINGSINNQEWSFQATSTMINNLCSVKLKALVKSSVKSCTHLIWEYQSWTVWQFNLRKSVSTKFPYYVPHQWVTNEAWIFTQIHFCNKFSNPPIHSSSAEST